MDKVLSCGDIIHYCVIHDTNHDNIVCEIGSYYIMLSCPLANKKAKAIPYKRDKHKDGSDLRIFIKPNQLILDGREIGLQVDRVGYLIRLKDMRGIP